MNVLGINCSLHDISIALMIDNKLVFAIEEERLSKMKHHGGVLLNGTMPQKALQMIYKKFPGIQIDAYYYCGDIFFQPVYISERCQKQLSFIKQIDPNLNQSGFVDHHLCHALAAFAESGFNESTIVVADGEGDSCSTSIWHIKNGAITPVIKFPPQSSLGLVYSYITDKLGFHMFGDEGKVMALADYGTACNDFNDIISFGHNYFEVNYPRLRDFGKHAMNAKTFQDKANTAATLQTIIESAMIWLTKLAISLTNCYNICLTGGVAYNCKSNYQIWQAKIANRLFVPNMPGDSGNSIGAALYPLVSEGKYKDYYISPYVGSAYTTEEVQSVLRDSKLAFSIEYNVVDKIAKLLAEHNVVLLFYGKMEFGPRALGNRSILAPITQNGISNFINSQIKHRELWRPFAPAILSDYMADYFENPIDSPYMSFAELIKPTMRDYLKEVSSVDGTARVQTVHKSSDSILYDILYRYNEYTGIPLLLNTSFNDKNQPLVESIEDAIKMFYTCSADYLVLGNIIISK